MRVIVVGAGDVGFDVARMLSTEQHDVTVIDTNAEKLEALGARLDVLTLVGSGTSADTLESARVQEVELLIAVTNIDEVNIIASMMAERLGKNPTTIARVRSGEFSTSDSVLRPSDFGLDLLINPEETTANEVVRLIRRASATDVLTFGEGAFQLVGMRVDVRSPLINRPLYDIVAHNTDVTFRVMGIARGMRTILPRGDEIVKRNDQIFVLVEASQVAEMTKALGKADQRMNHIMILGGNAIGARVARELGAEKGRRIKLIDPRRRTCERLAEDLNGTLVIHGDPTDIDLLVTEGLGEMDALIAVTADEESNLVTCLLGKHLGVGKTVSLLSKGAYIPFSQTIGLDAAVNRKLAISREIMRFLRGKHVKSVATVHGLDAEILEIQAEPGAPITRKPLKETRLPKGLLLGGVIRNGHTGIAVGDTHIQPGDRVILFALPDRLDDAEKLFR